MRQKWTILNEKKKPLPAPVVLISKILWSYSESVSFVQDVEDATLFVSARKVKETE